MLKTARVLSLKADDPPGRVTTWETSLAADFSLRGTSQRFIVPLLGGCLSWLCASHVFYSFLCLASGVGERGSDVGEFQDSFRQPPCGRGTLPWDLAWPTDVLVQTQHLFHRSGYKAGSPGFQRWGAVSVCWGCHTRTPQMGRMNNRYFFPTVPEAGESKTQVAAWLGSSEQSPGLQKAASPWCPHRAGFSLSCLFL